MSLAMDYWVVSSLKRAGPEGPPGYAYGGPRSLNIYSHLGLTSISNEPRSNALVVNESNVGVGTPNQFGNGQGVLAIREAAVVPTTNPIDAALFYAYDSVMYVLDEVGNAMPISSHPAEEIEALAAADDPYPLFQKATNKVIGKEIVIDKGKAFRLLQTLFPKERFIWYQDVPKIDITAIQKEEWKKNWITENTKEPEVSKDEALEVVEVSIEDTKKVISEKITYALEGRNVIEVRTPVYAKTPEQKWQLKKGARFDTNTGKFFMRKEPTEEEVEAAASQHFQLVLKKWIRDRM